MPNRSTLEALCRRLGIDTTYTDVFGQPHDAPDATLEAFCAALGCAPTDDASAQAAIAAWDARDWQAPLPGTCVARIEAGTVQVGLRLPVDRAERAFAWRLTLEDGRTRVGEVVPAALPVRQAWSGDGRERREYALRLDDVPMGYHALEIGLAGEADAPAATRLIACPPDCLRPDEIRPGLRIWGPAVQLYAVRSRRNWGIGDFGDLRRVVELAAAAGAGVVGLNPLHALFLHEPAAASPYSPSNRAWLNPLYLEVESIEEFGQCEPARARVATAAFAERLEALRAGDLVDYPGVAAAKLEVLELLWRHFIDAHLGAGSAHAAAFAAFRAEGGESLRRHALFEALQAHLWRRDPAVWGWPAWPEAYRDVDSPEVERFEREQAERVDFHAWLQWHAERQLAAIGARARELGMPVGLYRDLAVGVSSGGSETWMHRESYALGARVGAPPDDFNPHGQDWGLPPMIPTRLVQTGYRSFIEALRANMRHAGALRIDHVMTLMRLFWVPPDASPLQGAYVGYPLADLSGIVALESRRNRCIVIGEDLGTVPDAVRAMMGTHGMLSYRPLYFEREPDGAFRAPQAVPAQALVALSTHDLPTLRGFWRGADLETRQALALFPGDEQRARALLARSHDRVQLLLALDRAGLLPAGAPLDPLALPEPDDAFVAAVHAYLARTPASLLAFQLEDAFGQVEQVNLPGTTEATYPNWRRKLPAPIEQWGAHASLARLTGALTRERGAAPRIGPDPVGDGRASSAQAVIPRATYRVQFHAGFGFADATRIVPYLAALGVSHLYASPYLKARPGSTHGYDIVDHHAINPEIGSVADFERLCDTLAEHGIAQILDVVPNHMGVLGADNGWWLDVLEHGQASRYAGHFDIDWAPASPHLADKVLLPVLGDQYGAVLDRGELRLAFDASAGELSVRYYEHRFPIDPREYGAVLDPSAARLRASGSAGAPGNADAIAADELASLAAALGHLPSRLETAAERIAERTRDSAIHKRRLAELCARAPAVGAAIDEAVRELNGAPGDAASLERLHALLEAQTYRLANWRVAADDINYRRFFDINDLGALRMESQAVFDDVHRLVFRLLDEGRVQALRIDHPDGLYDPGEYFERLQRRTASGKASGLEPVADGATQGASDKPMYLVVEKILAEHEHLPASWPVHGDTGYRFVNLVNRLLVDPAAEARFDRIHAAFTGRAERYDEVLYHAKRLILSTSLSSEFTVLSNALRRIARADRHTRDFTLNALRAALAELIAAFPVYRTYIVPGRATDIDRRHVDWAIAIARRRSRQVDASVFDFIRDVLLVRGSDPDAPDRELVRAFVGRFQQVTAPVTAKAMEDTSFYVYNRLASLNEVGGDPRAFGLTVQAFHRAAQETMRHWPHTMLATSTHDTKRGEDVRARIDVLSEMPARWRLALRRWSRLNARHKTVVDGDQAPSRNDEYLLYQTLLGAWPFGEVGPDELEAFRARIDQYMRKAVREAKLHSSWVNPNADYEQALSAFIGAILRASPRNRFLESLKAEQRIVARFGVYNGLTQTLLKLTAPGVPDVYQGSELWNLSLVDPDNRSPVDYARREALLRSIDEAFAPEAPDARRAAAALLDAPQDGAIKLLLVRQALACRNRWPDLFERGRYLPITVRGARSEHVCAFARVLDDRQVIVVATRLLFRMVQDAEGEVTGQAWRDTALELPGPAAPAYRDLLTAAVSQASPGDDGAMLSLSAVLQTLPVALLVSISPAQTT